MATYTLVVTLPDGAQQTALSEFADDKTAISDAGAFVSAEHPVVGLARGAGEETEFLGAWDWNGGQKTWTAED